MRILFISFLVIGILSEIAIIINALYQIKLCKKQTRLVVAQHILLPRAKPPPPGGFSV